jgi:hypothetical protein
LGLHLVHCAVSTVPTMSTMSSVYIDTLSAPAMSMCIGRDIGEFLHWIGSRGRLSRSAIRLAVRRQVHRRNGHIMPIRLCPTTIAPPSSGPHSAVSATRSAFGRRRFEFKVDLRSAERALVSSGRLRTLLRVGMGRVGGVGMLLLVMGEGVGMTLRVRVRVLSVLSALTMLRKGLLLWMLGVGGAIMGELVEPVDIGGAD